LKQWHGQTLSRPAWATATVQSTHHLWKHKRAAFEAWTKSQEFAAAHRNAGNNAGLYNGHPEFEGFEPVISLLPKGKAA
jgi:heme-degrading monooxygenase HmoA